MLVLTSFDLSVAADGSEERQQLEAYDARARTAGVTVVDQLWLLECVSKFRVAPLADWTSDGTGVRGMQVARRGLPGAVE